MLRLPPNGHPVRTLLDTAELVALTTPSALKLPTIPEARAIARERFKTSPPPVTGAQHGDMLTLHNLLVLSEDGRVLLVGFGPKGSYKVRWNFGRVEP